jgi:hypothetical protein
LLAGAFTLGFFLMYYVGVLARNGIGPDGGFLVAFGVSTTLLLVGAWDLRCWLHRPRDAARWSSSKQVASGVSDAPPALSIPPGGVSRDYGRDYGRDWVTLTRHQVENDLLPHICMVCGTPTLERVSTTFSHDVWFKTRLMRVACPLCPRHRGHWRNLVLTASTGWLLMFFLGGIGLLVGMESYPRQSGAWVASSGIGFMTGLAVYVVSIIYLANTRIKVDSITGDEIKLQRVSATFANAVAAQSAESDAASHHAH